MLGRISSGVCTATCLTNRPALAATTRPLQFPACRILRTYEINEPLSPIEAIRLHLVLSSRSATAFQCLCVTALY